jgi:hypothetical protein
VGGFDHLDHVLPHFDLLVPVGLLHRSSHVHVLRHEIGPVAVPLALQFLAELLVL